LEGGLLGFHELGTKEADPTPHTPPHRIIHFTEPTSIDIAWYCTNLLTENQPTNNKDIFVITRIQLKTW
jgi:hypothetical protein